MIDQATNKPDDKQPEFNDEELIKFLRDEISRHSTNAGAPIHDRRIAMTKAILAHLQTPRPKYSGCKWWTDKRGGFELHAYISADDFKTLKLPVPDANLFHQLMEKNTSVCVLNALGLVFGLWQRQRQEEQVSIAKMINETAGSA